MWRLIAAQFPWLISIAAAWIGAAVLVLGAWDTESLALLADHLAADGEATQFPADRIGRIQDRTTLVGAFWLLLALLTALLYRRKDQSDAVVELLDKRAISSSFRRLVPPRVLLGWSERSVDC